MSTDSTDAASLIDRLVGRPWLTVAVVLALLVVLYGVVVQQELLLVVWLLLAGFVAHLGLRFVRAFERIAGAAERLARSED